MIKEFEIMVSMAKTAVENGTHDIQDDTILWAYERILELEKDERRIDWLDDDECCNRISMVGASLSEKGYRHAIDGAMQLVSSKELIDPLGR